MVGLCSQTESYGEDATIAREAKRKTLVAPFHLLPLPPVLQQSLQLTEKKVKSQVTWEPGTQPAMINT